MRYRGSPVTAYFMAIVCGVLLCSSLTAACTQNKRADTIHAAILAVSDAREGFTTWDLQHQHVIVQSSASREDATARVAQYRAKQAKVVATFEVVFKALGLAATQNDDLSLTQALRDADDLLASVKALRKGEE